MRRKIAKRRRREILRRGAVIDLEYWDYDECGKAYIVHASHCGWNIATADRDELSAYQGILACLPVCEEEPRTEEGEE